MKEPRLEQGHSDPVSYTCTCGADSSGGGTVLLFYRYYTAFPPLPAEFSARSKDTEEVAGFHRALADENQLAGKVRIAEEGFNVTIAGTTEGVERYVEACCAHWSFAGLDLQGRGERDAFFKPSKGCACVFQGMLKVKVAAEATPMGVTDYVPKDWSKVGELGPKEWHEMCKGEVALVDVRNHYESKIGYFVRGDGGVAVRPGIRRFSQWPQWVGGNVGELEGGEGEGEENRPILTYCTGGIRCEKGVRWMQEFMEVRKRQRDVEDGEKGERKVFTLKGGIATYLTWVDEEIQAGRMTKEESLFKGKNYVFDARGAMGLTEEVEPVAECNICGTPSDELSKCHSAGCHLVLVVCPACQQKDPRCCQSCRDIDTAAQVENIQERKGPRQLCECEQAREAELWKGDRVKEPKTQGWRKAKAKAGKIKGLDFRLRIID